jgi:hypothetical protein
LVNPAPSLEEQGSYEEYSHNIGLCPVLQGVVLMVQGKGGKPYGKEKDSDEEKSANEKGSDKEKGSGKGEGTDKIYRAGH